MVSFPDVIPYFMWGIFGAALIMLLIVVSRLVGVLRTWFGKDNTRDAERQAEGVWWFVSEALHILLIVIVFIVGFTIVDYLLTSPPDTSIYDLVLGTWTTPMVVLIVVYFAFKTLPYMMKKAFGRSQVKDEGGM